MTFPSSHSVLAYADPVVLVGFVQPVLMLVLVAGWAWLVSAKLDKDAQYFHLPRKQWSIIHIIVGAAAIALYLFVPEVATASGYWLNLPLLAISLTVSPIAYMLVRNKKVPEENRFRFTTENIAAALQKRRMAKAIRSASLSFKMADGTVYQTPPRDDPAYAVHLGAEEVLLTPMESRAASVILGPAKNGEYVMQMMVDGVTQPVASPQSAPPADVITYFKQLANLDITDRRRRQRAVIKAIDGTHQREIKVVTDGSAAGMRLSLTIDPTKQVNIKLDKLGLLPSQRQLWDELTGENHGIVLVAANPKQGRTTSLYALIASHDAYLTNVQVLELETERLIEGVRHNVFDPTEEDAEFWSNLRAILRRDPDVVGISELVDEQTAPQVAAGGVDGPRVYLTLRAENALQGLQQYIKAVGDADKAGDGLVGLIGVRLLRRLCETCRVPYQPTEAAVKKLNLPANRVKQLYKPGGKVILKGNNPETCPECGGSGYLGQTGVYEVLLLGDEERETIKTGDLPKLRAELRKKKAMFIPDAALAKVMEGVTSIEEVNRVLRPAAKQRKSRSESSAGATAS